MARRQREALTVRRINRIIAPEQGGRAEVADGKVQGLVVRVTSNAVRTFSYLYRSPTTGRQRRVTLNRWPQDAAAQADSLKEARHRALTLQAEVAAGRDPMQDRRPATGHTLADLAGRFIELEARPSIKTWRALERILELHVLRPLGGRDYRDVTRADLYEILDGLVGQGKPGAAGEVRKALSRLFNWAMTREYVQASPAALLRHRALDGRREAGRSLADDELRAVWLGTARLGMPWQQAIRVILLTGARRSEVAESRWSEVDERRRLIQVPATRYKTGREHLIPLSDTAWAEVAEVPRWSGADPYVFSVQEGLSPVRGFARIKERLDEAAAELLGRKLLRYRFHDLRVTLRTRLSFLGVAEDVAEAVLGHTRPGIVGVYNKYGYLDERREALERYASHVAEVVDAQRAA